MEIPIGHYDWRVLRTVLRAKGKPVSGRELRIDMSRRTKDGQFLTKLVKNGLLTVKVPADDPFEAKYAITPLGKDAAEFGVYQVDLHELRARRTEVTKQKRPVKKKAR